MGHCIIVGSTMIKLGVCTELQICTKVCVMRCGLVPLQLLGVDRRRFRLAFSMAFSASLGNSRWMESIS